MGNGRMTRQMNMHYRPNLPRILQGHFKPTFRAFGTSVEKIANVLTPNIRGLAICIGWDVFRPERFQGGKEIG